MNVSEWLAGIDPPPPEALTAAIRRALHDRTEAAPESLLAAAEELLRTVLAGECTDRSSALDLLTVDALVTHALQLAVDKPELLDRFPEKAMLRIARSGAQTTKDAR